ncbi:unnamed protein product [Rotaria sp. Silwood1]|nr:unnamed protein product [Rotaria sp. Silwood1]
MIILVSITVIFINTYVLSKRNLSDNLSDKNFRTGEQIYNQNQTDEYLSFPQENKQIKRLLVPDAGCEIDETCSHDSIPYKVISGTGTDKYPMICFNNKLLVHKNLKDSKISRGSNIVVIDGKTYDVKLVETFDTYLEENFFLRTLKLKINDGDILILASFDEMTYGLRDASLSLLENYGSQSIKKVKYRDSFVMIGQKGLAPYDIINGSIELIYRVDQFYGLGYLLRHSFYEKNMKDTFKDCCSKRVWEKWTFSDTSSFLMPDVSRVYRRPIDGNRVNTKYVETLFNRKRKTSL